MLQKLLGIFISLGLAVGLAAAAGGPSQGSKLTATQIVDRNIQARGGLQAWRAVKTMVLTGKLGAGGDQRYTSRISNAIPGHKPGQPPAPEVDLPFRMMLARPRKMRFELQFNGKTAIQVYDGVHGWKLRPFLNRLQVEPYTPEELKIASTQADLDGPLVDYAAKGTRIELVGQEKVEGRDTYKIKLIKKSGQRIHVWIDAQTFLETKIEGQPRRLDGKDHKVEIYFRDYRPVKGLQIPFTLETKVLPVRVASGGFLEPPIPPEKIVVKTVEINPKLQAALFTKPNITSMSSSKPDKAKQEQTLRSAAGGNSARHSY